MDFGIDDKDVAHIAGVINGFTVTVEALRSQVEELTKKKLRLIAKVFGREVLNIKVELTEE